MSRPNAEQIDFISGVRGLANEAADQQRIAVAVKVVPNSWDPVEGTVRVISGNGIVDQDGADPDADPLFFEPVPISSMHIGVQGGPIGFERGVAIPVDDGWRVLLDHGPDDSPNAQAGEFHAHLRSMDENQTRSCYVKVQTDAVRLSHTKRICALAQTVELGQENIARDGYRISRDSDVQQAINDLRQAVQNVINSLCQHVQPGTGIPPPQVASVTAHGSQTAFSI